MSDINTWSITDGSNNSASPDGFPEGMDYSEVNNSARAVMGAVARLTKDTDGSLAAAGTNALTITLNRTSIVAYYTGMRVSFTAANSNTGSMTVNINAIGSRNLLSPTGETLGAGNVIAGRVYDMVYDGTTFQLIGARSAGIDTLDLYDAQSTAQNRAFRLTSDSDQLRLLAYNDDFTAGSFVMTIDRTLNVIDEIDLNATLFDLHGAMNLSGALTVDDDITANGSVYALAPVGSGGAEFIFGNLNGAADEKHAQWQHSNAGVLALQLLDDSFVAQSNPVLIGRTAGNADYIRLNADLFNLDGPIDADAAAAAGAHDLNAYDGVILQGGVLANGRLQVGVTANLIDISNATLAPAVSSTTRAGFRIGYAGPAPTAPENGDMWADGTGLYIRIGGVTRSVDLT